MFGLCHTCNGLFLNCFDLIAAFFFLNITLLIYSLKTPVVLPPIRSKMSLEWIPKEQLMPCHCRRCVSGVLKVAFLIADFLLLWVKAAGEYYFPEQKQSK